MKSAGTRLLFAMMLAVVFGVSHGYAAKEKAPIATVAIKKAPELYAADPVPMTPSQCGQCHTSHFKTVRTDGGKHQFECQKCHQVFHAYSPKKANYDALMPKCDSCHNQPHGKTMTDCGTCHTNAHAPKKVVMGQRLLNNCTECHGGPKQQLAQFPSKHTKVSCQKCHTSHGYIPNCSACHKPHYPNQPAASCLKCHPVHKPTQISWDATTATTETCNACHSKVVSKLKGSKSRHSKVGCVECHKDKHKFKPNCQMCHPAAHKPEFLKRFPKCLTCHIDAHDPPAK